MRNLIASIGLWLAEKVDSVRDFISSRRHPDTQYLSDLVPAAAMEYEPSPAEFESLHKED